MWKENILRKTNCQFVLPLATLILLVACGTAAPNSPAPAALMPYLTLTPSPTTTPDVGTAAADTALPSPTPFTYTIQAGDTLSALAQKFGVPLDALIAANPNVSPNAMSVGQTLLIPTDKNNPTGEATPTAVPFAISQIQCYPTLDNGMWCFALARNDSADALENVSAGRRAGGDSAPQRFTAAFIPAADSFLSVPRARGRVAARPDFIGHDSPAQRCALPERVPAQPADRDRVRWPHRASERTGVPAREQPPCADGLGDGGTTRRAVWWDSVAGRGADSSPGGASNSF
jgi:LysM repeat protein